MTRGGRGRGYDWLGKLLGGGKRGGGEGGAGQGKPRKRPGGGPEGLNGPARQGRPGHAEVGAGLEQRVSVASVKAALSSSSAKREARSPAKPSEAYHTLDHMVGGSCCVKHAQRHIRRHPQRFSRILTNIVSQGVSRIDLRCSVGIVILCRSFLRCQMRASLRGASPPRRPRT